MNTVISNLLGFADKLIPKNTKKRQKAYIERFLSE